MNYEVIDGMVHIPLKKYKQIEATISRMEDKEDIAALDEALGSGSEYLPGDVAKALVLREDSPLRIIRKHRALTQDALAEKAGVTKTTISEIENGRKEGSIKLFKKLSEILGVDIDDLI